MIVCPACQHEFSRPASGGIPFDCPRCGSTILGRYCDLAPVGSGGMGTVYQARRPDMGDRIVAIKIPNDSHEQARRRFEREIAASSRLEHENIVRALDRGQEDGWPYLVMEFVTGRMLSEVIEQEPPLAEARVARIMRGLAAGLAHADQRGVINRDLKPDNVLLTDDDTAKILDYGLALLDGPEQSDRVTRPGVLLGTTGFMAPEQAQDPHSVTIGADMYALGCTAVSALTGRTPFSSSGGHQVWRLHATAPRPSVRQRRPDISAEFDELLQRVMAISPAERPCPAELIEALDRLIARLADSPPPPLSPPVVRAAEQPATPDVHGRSSLPAVHCPECGEAYHLRTEAVGQWMWCHNAECGNRFRVRWPESQAGLSQSQPRQPGQSTDRGGLTAQENLEHMVTRDDLQDPPPVVANVVVRGEVFTEEHTADRPEVVRGEAVQPLPVAGAAEPEATSSFELQDSVPPLPDDAPPVAAEFDSGPAGPEQPEIQMLPASAVVAGAIAEDSSPPMLAGNPVPPAGRENPGPRPRRRPRRIHPLVVLAGSLLLMLGVWGLTVWFTTPPDLEAQWAEVQEEYQLRKWNRAEQGLAEFAEQFPDSPRVADVPFFLDMCRAGRDVFSQTGDAEQGLAEVQQIFLDHRDTPQYEAYCADLYMSLVRLVERFVDEAEKTSEPIRLERAGQAHQLLLTVAEAMEDEWVPQRTARLSRLIADADKALELALARREVLAMLEQLQQPGQAGQAYDAGYGRVQRLLQQHGPPLAEDRQVQAGLEAAYRSEAERVVYEPDDPDQQQPELASDDQDSVFVVWEGGSQPPSAGDQEQVVTALSQGVLYVFSPQGRFLWARRLGIDSHRPPLNVPPTATSPALLIAVSTLDNSLLALQATTGQVLWQYRAGQQDLSAPLTLVPAPPQPDRPTQLRGWLPTASGEIHVLELARGKRVGRYKLGFPMTVGGTYDEQTGLVFFPADSRRVFALDPAAIESQSPDVPAARSVLLTDHPSGSLHARPVVVGQYLILTESSELEHTRVRAFEVKPDAAFPDPRASPVKQFTLQGWSWFPPYALPDRIAVVTDAGHLGVFGLNLDNVDEALYPIIQDAQGDLPRLPVQDPFRALAIGCDEHLLWLMADGKLQLLALDLLHQQIKTLWPGSQGQAAVTGIPLHQAQVDQRGGRIYVATQSQQGHPRELTAVDAETGTPLWQRQLGLRLQGDPLVRDDDVLLIDHTGRIARLDWAAGTVPASQPLPIRLVQEPLAPPADPSGGLMRLETASGDLYLVMPVQQGKRLAIRKLSGKGGEQSPWKELPLADRLQGRPGICGRFLVVPCSDGRLHRVALDGAPSNGVNELTYQWAPPHTLAPHDTASVYPLADDAVLLLDGPRARHLRLVTQDGVRQWKQQGGLLTAAAPLLGPPLAGNQQLVLADEDGTIYGVTQENPARVVRQWSLPGKITAAPFLRDRRMLVITDHRRLACLAVGQDQPQWTSSFPARICGQPVLEGQRLLVTDQRGQVTAVELESGELQWRVDLGPGAMAAAAAVPLAPGRILAPLADGSLIQRSLPQSPEPEIAKAQP